MAGEVLNFKVCSPFKRHSGLTGKNPAICHYSYNLPMSLVFDKTIQIDYLCRKRTKISPKQTNFETTSITDCF